MLYTDEYKDQLNLYHQENRLWGSGPRSKMPRIGKFICDNNVTEFVDYGCGKGEIMKTIFPCRVHSYDPGVPKWSADPPTAPYLICMDVLEHIEIELMDNVLAHIDSKFTRKALLGISSAPAKEFLPDGRNAHLTQRPTWWWVKKLQERFRIESAEFGSKNTSSVITLSKV